jgi:hypothetical protein
MFTEQLHAFRESGARRYAYCALRANPISTRHCTLLKLLKRCFHGDALPKVCAVRTSGASFASFENCNICLEQVVGEIGEINTFSRRECREIGLNICIQIDWQIESHIGSMKFSARTAGKVNLSRKILVGTHRFTYCALCSYDRRSRLVALRADMMRIRTSRGPTIS